MADFLHDDELLLKYLDGELNSEEASDLDERLQRDAALQEKLDTLRLAADSVRLYGIQKMVGDVRAQWEGQSNTRPGARAKVISMRRTLLYAVSSVACLVLLVVGIRYFSAPHLSSDDIYRQTYVSFDLDRSRSGAANVTKLEQAWQEHNYIGVVNIGSKTSLNALDQLLLGLAYLQLHRPANAIPVFQTLLAASDNHYDQDAEFYLGLSYLEAHDPANALKQLEKIERNPNHLYHQQVSEQTIRDIKNLK